MRSIDIRGHDAERWSRRSSQLPTATSRAGGRAAFAANAAGAQVAARLHAAWKGSGTVRQATIGLLVALAYYAGARLGFLLVFPGSPLSVIWPPNAIVLAALLLVPPRAWWIVLLGVLPAHLVVEWQSGVAPLAVPGLYVTNCGEALLGATIVRRLSGGGPPWLGTLQQVVVYVVGAAIAAPFVASFLDTSVVVVTHWAAPREYWLLWEQRFISAVLTNLTVAPVILLLACGGWRGWRTLPRRRRVEAALLALTILGSSYVAFSPRTAMLRDTPELLYLLVPMLLWAAVRFGVGGISTSLLAVALLAAGWADASGLFVARAPAAAVVTLQLFLIALGAPAFCLAGLVKERERDNAALRASQEQYRAVVETQTEMITRYLPDTTVTFVNEASCRTMEMSREELLGTKFIELLPDSAREAVRATIQSLLAHPGVLTVEHQVRLPDGTLGWQQWVNRTILDQEGRVIELQGIGRDTTERRRAEEALCESEARFRAAFESAGAGMLLVDTAGHPLQVNRPFAEMLGYSEAELRTKTFAEFTYPDDWEPNLTLFHQALAGQIDRYQLEKRYVHKQGHLVWVYLSAGVVRDPAGQPLYLVAQVQDITDRKRLEREREEARASELAQREVNRHMEQFLATASHDLRTPVTGVVMGVAVAQRRLQHLAAAVPPTKRASTGDRPAAEQDTLGAALHSLERASGAAQRLSQLIVRLFDVAQARTGTLELKPAPCDLAAVVREQVAEQRALAPERPIQLVLDASTVVPVVADGDRLGQVLANYLTNALKYAPADQPVVVSLAVEAGQARVAVRDAGPGLPPEEQTRVWELFHRAPGVTPQGSWGGSMGLGLYICKQIVEGHEGQVGVESVVGEGSTFWFTLPLASAQ